MIAKIYEFAHYWMLTQIRSKELFQCRPGLIKRLGEEQAKPEPNDALVADIQTALQFIQEDYAGQIRDLEQLTYNEISYELLWVIFPPNVLVYRFHIYTEQPQILLARSLEYLQRPNGSLYAKIACDVINNDGNSFGLARDDIEIDAFRGARRIRDLPLFPIEHLPNKDEICALAAKRGKKFVGLAEHSYHEISGAAMRETMNQNWETRQFKFSVSWPHK